jgi:hypothetical protein
VANEGHPSDSLGCRYDTDSANRRSLAVCLDSGQRRPVTGALGVPRDADSLPSVVVGLAAVVLASPAASAVLAVPGVALGPGALAELDGPAALAGLAEPDGPAVRGGRARPAFPAELGGLAEQAALGVQVAPAGLAAQAELDALVEPVAPAR